ncbi:hypothetical protein, partial [Yersinia artesiana]|uniref:hypothetical protein n=1 Tax=Yersinia artesiana TaxID=2890315 RepID=UPI001D129012
MSELLASIKSSIKPSISNHMPAMPLSRGFERLQPITRSYIKNDWKVKDKTAYKGKEIVRSVLTERKVINNIETVKIKTFDSATNKMNHMTQLSEF